MLNLSLSKNAICYAPFSFEFVLMPLLAETTLKTHNIKDAGISVINEFTLAIQRVI
jgi:hypothetical protein